MDKIRIKKLEVFAKHGVFPEENVLGQKFVISATLHINTRQAGLTDDLSQSINYGEVCQFIKSLTENNVFKLLETLAEELAQGLLLQFSKITKIDILIEKPWAPIGLPLETASVEITRGWHTAYIALGSNMGDKKDHLDTAVKTLDSREDCSVMAVSDYRVTPPYGVLDQDDFLNGALALHTLLPPEELLDVLQGIEANAHRERIIHWGPRTLDLDILLYDDLVLDTPTLHIPHIEMHLRDFVLVPLAQIAPWVRHPVLGKTVAVLCQQVNSDELKRA
ncbi:2-amino-4-hydroxy-6-hydroxymethyldihydropteridine diphosphokinase [Eubacterium barkeri]|uniref:Bifunctional folate synthesis protein n=1 Tax=Eubacterium barkeri TaxID=1528 RepID=A0A1H3DXJ9_EUBBA|nr:2-amino-4-hydroxy-6-hydroxymethyldihydropteridine diphosphokinase [Eubacterium barkeri]SDX71222.1 dihydroneopterin aldolase / 2-amino-4-hydroxy-6-hydroxymethyldihydropteridine diphosphokinase [Eubacterium barkeri]